MSARRVQCIFCHHTFTLRGGLPSECTSCLAELPDDTYIVDLGPLITGPLDQSATKLEDDGAELIIAEPRLGSVDDDLATAKTSDNAIAVANTDTVPVSEAVPVSDASTDADIIDLVAEAPVAQAPTSHHINLGDAIEARATTAEYVPVDKRENEARRRLDDELRLEDSEADSEALFADFSDETAHSIKPKKGKKASEYGEDLDLGAQFGDEDTLSSNLDLDALASAVEDKNEDDRPLRWRCTACLAEFGGTMPSFCPACGVNLES
jgi:rubrerythrin